MPDLGHSQTGNDPAPSPDSICIVRLSAIGDCCHTLPVVRTLQTVWPDTQLTWIIGKTEFELMRGISGVEFITFDKSGGWPELARLRHKLGARRFSVLLHMHASMRANLASLCVRADRRIGFDRIRARDYQWLFTRERIAPRAEQHVVDGLFSFLEHLGIVNRDLRWDIPIDDEDRDYASQIASSPYCVISPCSSQRFRNFRNWRSERYAALVDHLEKRHGVTTVLTGGPTPLETEYGQLIMNAAQAPVTNLIGKTTLKQLLAVIERAALVVCPDSGPAHMATSVGTPVIGLYATSNRYRTGPYLSNDFTIDKYPDAVRREFNKDVAELRWGERVRTPDAMDMIAVEDVTTMIDRVLN